MVKYEIVGHSGGGGGKSSSSKSQGGTEQGNSLISRSNLRILYMLGEGEIQGAFDSMFGRSVYIDDVPLQNADGSFNFTGVKLYFRPGTLTQNYIGGFEASSSEIQVGTQVKKTLGSVVKTVSSSDVNAVVFRFLFPQLQKVDQSKNKITETSVTYSIDVKTNNGAWVNRLWYTLNGKNTSPFEAFHRIDLPAGDTFDLRVTRITDDSTSSTLSNDMFWQSYTEIIDAKLRYPNTALLGMVLSADQFKSVPQISFKGKFKKVLIPNNYDPVARSYSGVWNGGFSYAYTNNPAWVAYDLLINSRYGVGERISASALNKWSFYAIAQYCDELVPSRSPGKPSAPRFTCNAQIREPQDAYDLLNEIASSFRGSFYWSSGTITAIQDKPKTPVKLFTRANTLQETDDQGRVTSPCFKYKYSSKTSRHTVALVSYSEPSNRYQKEVEYVEHSAGLSRYGYNPISIQAFGCTSRDEAHRLGLWTLEVEQSLTVIVTFRIGAVGSFVAPGEIIEITDPLRSVQRLGGRISSISGDRLYITLDAEVIVATSAVVKLNGGSDIPLEYGILGNTVVDGKTVLQLNNAVDSTVESYDMWMLSTPSIRPTQYSVWSIVDKSDEGYYEVTAIAYNSGIFSTVDYGVPLQIPPTTVVPPAIPNAPFNIVSIISPVLRDGVWSFDIGVSWSEPTYFGELDPYTESYQIEYREGFTGAWGYLQVASDNSISFPMMGENIYFFRVRAKDVLNRFSNWVYSIASVVERPIPKEPIGTVVKTKTNTGGVVLTWSDSQSYTFGIVGYRIYVDSELVATVANGVFQSPEIIRPPGSYLGKITPVDSSGNEAPVGLLVGIGDEFRPLDPMGEVSLQNTEEGIKFSWSDITNHTVDFFGYQIVVNGLEVERTPNKFSSILDISLDEEVDIRIYALNNLGYVSTGYLLYSLGLGSGSASVPNPLGAITKINASDGGIALSWIDAQTYTNFAYYRVYLDGLLQGEVRVKKLDSILVPVGTYSIVIKAVSRVGLQSIGGLSVNLLPEDFLPPNPRFLLVQQTLQGMKQFYWESPPSSYKDLVAFRVRFNIGSNLSWEDSHFIKDIPINLLQFETALFREGTYTILMKLVDSTGYESEEAVNTQVNLFDPVPDNVVEQWDFRTPSSSTTGDTPFLSRASWQGTLTNLEINGDGDLEVIDPLTPAMFDSTFDVTSDGHLKATQDIEGNFALFYERLVQGVLWTGGNDSDIMWSLPTDSEIFWKQYDQYILFPVSVLLDQEEYKIRVLILPSAIPGKIKQLKVLVDAPDIVSNINDFSVSSLGSRIPPIKPMNVLKAVNLTLQYDVANTATRLIVVDKDPVLGALVEAYDSSNNRVSALVDAVLVGY